MYTVGCSFVITVLIDKLELVSMVMVEREFV